MYITSYKSLLFRLLNRMIMAEAVMRMSRLNIFCHLVQGTIRNTIPPDQLSKPRDTVLPLHIMVKYNVGNPQISGR